MALIKCPECGNDCSDQADTCPKCGYPLKKKVSTQPVKVEYEYMDIKLRNWGAIGTTAVLDNKLKPYLDQGWEVVERKMPVMTVGTATQVYKIKLRRPKKTSSTSATK